MSEQTDLAPAFAALDDGDAALRGLDAGCCEPGRSPRMRALADALATIRAGLERMEGGDEQTGILLGALEDAGARVGSLQVGCCTPTRLPLYSRLLDDLTTVQITVSRAAGLGHASSADGHEAGRGRR